MADLSEIDRAVITKIAGTNNATGITDNYWNVDANGVAFVGLYNSAGTFADFNFGTAGPTTLRVASQIGNATGSADFGSGTTGSQTLRVVLPTDQTPIPSKITDGTNTSAVKAASTAPVAADPALVVTISPNSAQIIISPLPATGSQFSFGEVTTTSTTANQPIEKTTYTEQTTNGQRSLASSNAGDTSGGTGARTVQITYYDQTGAGPFTETVTMSGTTGANTVNTNICFIEKMTVTTVGSAFSNQGTITLFTAINKGGTTIGTITVGDNQTFWAHHYVPTGKTCYISGFSFGNNSGAAGNGGGFILKATSPSVANTAERQVSDFCTTAGATNTVTRNYGSPIQITGPARIRAYVTPYNGASTTQFGSFDFIDN